MANCCVIADCFDLPVVRARIVAADAMFSVDLCATHDAELTHGDIGWVQDRAELDEEDEAGA